MRSRLALLALCLCATVHRVFAGPGCRLAIPRARRANVRMCFLPGTPHSSIEVALLESVSSGAVLPPS